MRRFNEIEKEYQHTPIQTHESDAVDASGYLHVDKRNTEVVLASGSQRHFSYDPDGRFDLRLKLSSGEEVLVLNGISTAWRSYHRVGEICHHEATVFPNILVFGAKHIKSDKKVRSITFTFGGFEKFFTHQHIDSFYPDKNLTPELKRLKQKALNQLADSFKQYGSSTEQKDLRKNVRKGANVFQPASVFIVHHPRSPIYRFKVGNRRYEIDLGERRTSRHLGIDLEFQALATIKFPSPVLIDEATDYVWEWKRFFEQLSLESIEPNGISVKASRAIFSSESDVYLPNTDETHIKELKGRFPLSSWKAKKRLCDAMSSWLSQEEKRRVFRVSISRAIEDSKNRVSLDDIVSLCAAVDSLEELSEAVTITKTQVRLIAAAAVSKANEISADIDPIRIKSIISLLRNQSLPAKFGVLSARMKEIGLADDLALLISTVHRLRNISAHGHALPETTMPTVAPAVSGLLSLLVLFDLGSNAVPFLSEYDMNIPAMQALRESLMALNQLQLLAANSERPGTE